LCVIYSNIKFKVIHGYTKHPSQELISPGAIVTIKWANKGIITCLHKNNDFCGYVAMFDLHTVPYYIHIYFKLTRCEATYGYFKLLRYLD